MPHAVFSVAPTDTVTHVIAALKRHEVSQLPVVDGQRLAGLVSEVDLLNALVHQGVSGDTPVGELAGTDFAIVEPTNSAALLSDLFAQGKTVIVQDGAALVGILTKIDLIDFIAKRMR